DEESPQNIHMAVGTILEHDVLDLYERIHKKTGERDGCSVKGIARANTDYVTDDKVSDVKVSTKAQEWHEKGRAPIQYRRQLIHYCYVLNMSQASINDAKAITSGSPKKMSKRIGRRVTGKAAGKGIRKLFK